MINKLPTVYEIISGRVKAPPLGAARKPKVPKPAVGVEYAWSRILGAL